MKNMDLSDLVYQTGDFQFKLSQKLYLKQNNNHWRKLTEYKYLHNFISPYDTICMNPKTRLNEL